MTKEYWHRVHDWLTHSLPGHFDSETPQGALFAAYQASGLADKMTAEDFRYGLKLYGFEPKCIRNEPMLYRLSLPAAGPGVRVR